MLIVDEALKRHAAAGKTVRVGIVGAGVMGKAITRQIRQHVPGMAVVAVACRRIDEAKAAFTQAGYDAPVACGDAAAIARAIAAGKPAVTEDHIGLSQADGIDVVVEATGAFDYAAQAMVAAIDARKHVVLVNAELDGTVGPILKARADAKGVCYTAADGDQPGVTMNLARHVKGMGLKVVLAGNIKGLQDRYRTPETQAAFADKWGLKAHMVTSFADGTKISFEQTVIANGLGMGVAKRGMVGPDFSGGNPGAPLVQLEETIASLAPYIDLKGPGIADFVVGARPGPGVFVLATTDDPKHKKHLAYMKMGDGPLYCFYTPYHLCHFEVPDTIARAALFQDATLAPLGAPTVGVITLAKRALKAGETIDPIGGFLTYGQCENAPVIARERLLPIGLAEGCTLKRDIPRDAALTLDDVAFPQERLIDRLYREQADFFGLKAAAE